METVFIGWEREQSHSLEIEDPKVAENGFEQETDDSHSRFRSFPIEGEIVAITIDLGRNSEFKVICLKFTLVHVEEQERRSVWSMCYYLWQSLNNEKLLFEICGLSRLLWWLAKREQFASNRMHQKTKWFPGCFRRKYRRYLTRVFLFNSCPSSLTSPRWTLQKEEFRALAWTPKVFS